jgi:apolipoprotein N-acyltransferase
MIVILCAFLSGVLLYFGQGLDDVWGLAWIAPAPLLWLAYGPAPRWQLFLAALIAGLAGQVYLVQIYWGQLPAAMLVLLMVGVALPFAAVIMVSQFMRRNLPLLAVLFAYPALWTGCEYLVSLVSPHGSFGSIAYASMPFPASVQIASLFGIYGVSFSMCLFANALALGARGLRTPALLGVAICAAVFAFGFFRLATPQGTMVQVAALSDWEARRLSMRSIGFAASQKMAAEYESAARAEADKGAKLIVIPETALAVDPVWRTALIQPLADLARARGITVVIGTLGVRPWRNVALAFLPDGSVFDYDKRHLLPPGENKFTPGHRAGLIGGGQAVEICKDMDFERMLRSDMRSDVRGGVVRILAVPANDFIKDDWMHARMAMMRGVENGFALVRSASNGIATVSDAQGQVLASARTYKPGLTVIRAAVPLGPGPTLYTRIGDVFAWVCLALAAVLLAMGFAVRNGARRARAGPADRRE